jgi:hypothetical protein
MTKEAKKKELKGKTCERGTKGKEHRGKITKGKTMRGKCSKLSNPTNIRCRPYTTYFILILYLVHIYLFDCQLFTQGEIIGFEYKIMYA